MTSFVGRTFKSGNSEAVRLPKGVAYGAEIEVTIIRSGDVLTIYPTRPAIAGMPSPCPNPPVCRAEAQRAERR